LDLSVATDCSRQAAQYDLSAFAVFCASNSGRTREVVTLAQKVTSEGNALCYGLTARPGSLLADACAETFVLRCGWEEAVAATKSVVEQALFYESLLWHMRGGSMPDMNPLGDALEQALTMPVPQDIVAAAAQAPTLYFSGYNDGVAEELTLKTNEITRKKSDFLEGTYAVHGIEEVMEPGDVVFVVDPIDEESRNFRRSWNRVSGFVLWPLRIGIPPSRHFGSPGLCVATLCVSVRRMEPSGGDWKVSGYQSGSASQGPQDWKRNDHRAIERITPSMRASALPQSE
jgi:glucosamine 6-phosphate synthetase-like amidotransferase/phosphosugar isomerase protein